MTDSQEKMLRDLDKKVDSIIETLGGNNLGTKGLGNEFKDFNHQFYLHVEDNRKHFGKLYKYKNYATGALAIISVIWTACTAVIIKLLIN